jgi:NitT/TauT family transport system permease protein
VGNTVAQSKPSEARPRTDPGPRPGVRIGQGATYIAVPVLAIVAWQTAATLLAGSLGPFFPSPLAVGAAIWDWATGLTGVTAIYSGQLLAAIGASMRRILIGYAIACALGIPLGVLVGRLSAMRRAADPFLQMLRPIPVTAWVPISMLWFGIGDVAAVYLIVLATFFPIYINTMQGVRYVDPVTLRAGRMMGARGWRLLLYVVLPASLPSIFAGLRISVGFAWMAVVVSELVAVKNGLGYVMYDAYGFLRSDIVVAAMIVIGALGFACDRLMLLLERYLLGWAHNSREG